jgi:uncharacterized protein YndB with AHSA1/START domain
MASNKNSFVKDFAGGKIVVTHFCDADIDTVWDMWTKSELLDHWWAPKPWKAETESQDFRNGGRWFYSMAGPNNERQYSFADYKNISPKKSFEVNDGFADENGVVNKDMPQTNWKLAFNKSNDGVLVTITVSAPSADLKKLIDTGFEEGFKMGLNNLDEELRKMNVNK